MDPPPGTSGASGLARSRVLLDCRWLGIGGAGRVTELLLTGLQAVDPPGRWLLWGGEKTRDWRWRRSELLATDARPTRLGGQSDLLRVPGHDVALYMHQIRPLRPGRAITL